MNKITYITVGIILFFVAVFLTVTPIGRSLLTAKLTTLDNLIEGAYDGKESKDESLSENYKISSIPKGEKDEDKDNVPPLQSVIIGAIRAILYLAGSAAIIMIIIGGIRYIFASGSEDQIGNAKNTIIWALVGLVAIIFSFVIVENIVKYLGPENLPVSKTSQQIEYLDEHSFA